MFSLDMIMSIKNKILLIITLASLTACQYSKEQTNTLSEFFKALGSGDTSEIKKVDPNYCTDEM